MSEPIDGIERGNATLGSGWRILLVEDDDETANALKSGLEHLGYLVALAHDGPVALQVAKSFKPDICFIDMMLPVMAGYELIRRMSQVFEQQSRKVPFVAMTGNRTQFDRQTSLDAGCAEHLHKPLRAADVARVINSLFEPSGT